MPGEPDDTTITVTGISNYITAWNAKTFDATYYRGRLEKAWGEIAYAFPL